ncbi:Vms1/Ankzf1 family peptidyl-tRNA hydrolase [Pseudonocardia sp. KRD291]|uniref:baeRF2 domain-containing protein n=1 Tax=Pseudonocardia sp. KRD291 TaxID=2792007 RepID=UPI001C4A66A9|nr:Vms1/Ankzf1 family peptidyl-tRNA hydrolase [Pseudonocardia sp. KRD291]MBW0101143.1 hypothetical protein [Pseudonocardia sp. KRD291]
MRLDWLRTTTTDDGPFATVVLDVTQDTPDGAEQVRLRWRSAREDLARQGADDKALDRLEEAVTGAGASDGTGGRVLVAGADGVLVDRVVDTPPERGLAHWGTTPDLLSVATAVPEVIRTVVASIDEEGGEVRGPGDTEAHRVRGDSSGPVHKTSPGGPSDGPVQERVEETWRRNAQAVAAEVDTAVRSGAAQLVVLLGDARSRSRLRDELSAGSVELVAEIEHTGGQPSAELPDTVVAAADDVRTRRRSEALERFAAAAGRSDGLAVTGLADVASATRAHAVEVLVLDPERRPTDELWLGADPSEVSLQRDELVALGREPGATAEAASALVRAAVSTDAELVLAGPGAGTGVELSDGVGAVLRFPIGPGS